MKLFPFISLFILAYSTGFSQENLELYRGNKSFVDGDLSDAKSHYEKALIANPNSFKGPYNIGNATYKEENFEGAIGSYQQALGRTENPLEKAEVYHNLGNTYLQSGKLGESIQAYKDALRLNPGAQDTRYNLAFAQKMKKKEEQQQEQNKNDKKDDQQKDQEKKDGDEEEDEKGEKDKNKEDKQDEEGKENKDERGEGDEKDEQQAAPKPMNLSPREAEQMLEAAKNEDQKIQMQIRQQKKSQGKKIEKDW
jgi:Ca-activated chloride channel homolog